MQTGEGNEIVTTAKWAEDWATILREIDKDGGKEFEDDLDLADDPIERARGIALARDPGNWENGGVEEIRDTNFGQSHRYYMKHGIHHLNQGYFTHLYADISRSTEDNSITDIIICKH
jgi:hypothetical protein